MLADCTDQCGLVGVLCVREMSELPCQFTDEHVFLNNEGHTETQHIHREAMLQFGQKGDAPINPHAITFLVTGKKEMLKELECELRRYSTEGIHVRWPVQGAQEYNHWFSCTLKHSKGRFTVIGFLRHHCPAPLRTAGLPQSLATPSVKAGLGSQQKLHCQFAVDHKGPSFTVEWHRRSGQTQGTGVGLKSLAGGDASYTVPFTKMTSEGTYICSVSVIPLFANLDINLHIEEPPRVSVNVGPILSLQVDEDKKVVCDAENYYPLDVEIVWYEQDPAASGQRVGAPLPKVLQNVLASLKDSGRQFTCSVSHQSLRVPIKKSFILNVEFEFLNPFITKLDFIN
uniref:Ig-like domain-containing protein n=1 Tax=Monopterus albus TaxID=43700 RepID=A0A3Q3Q7A3_MONAL